MSKKEISMYNLTTIQSVPTVIFTVAALFLCTLLYAEETKTETIPSAEIVPKILPKILESGKMLKEKKTLSVMPPFPISFEKIDKEITGYIWILTYACENDRGIAKTLGLDETLKIEWNRKDQVEIHLAVLHTARMSIDRNYKRKEIFTTVFPIPDETDTDGVYFESMRPEDIKHPKTRENYIKAEWENFVNGCTNDIHSGLLDSIKKNKKNIDFYVPYRYRNRPDLADELIGLLEKYEYPFEDRVKLLCELNFPYKNYRQWESKDKLFKTAAKFVDFKNNEVLLEKPDGKQTTIEIEALRKEDQAFVRDRNFTPKEIEKKYQALLFINFLAVSEKEKKSAEIAEKIRRRELYLPNADDSKQDINYRNVNEKFREHLGILHDLSFSFVRLAEADKIKVRPHMSHRWLIFWKMLNRTFDPKALEEPSPLEEYEVIRAINEKTHKERTVQTAVQALLEETEKSLDTYFLSAYTVLPRRAAELVMILEEYDYPLTRRADILCTLNIPYKKCRIWESENGEFHVPAQFIELRENTEWNRTEVVLEMPDGRRTSLPLEVFRKEDQEYIKELTSGN